MNKETSEIVKLTERIAKDPKSKLFVPLAEEYKKAGDIEMSVHVLTEGLRNNPGYVTARSFLGRLLIERGDLAGAQKEFEEVVKAIPDNLMAQRKLADLYALQDRSADALNHYRIALSLNPKDQETAMLISEAEAGRDIKQHIHLPQPKPSITQEEPKKPEQPKTAAAPVQPKAAPQPQKAVTAPKAAAPAAVEHEEPEEVLVVEPLDAPSPVILDEKPAGGMDFPAGPPSDQPIIESEPEARDRPFSLDEPFPVSSEPFEDPEQAAEDPFALAVTEPAAETGEPHEQQSEKQADDFTTDTLAELYIAQGFFEKAVEIYERMLADKPNSQGLKDKLSKVRAMAAAGSGAGSEPEADELVTAEIIPDSSGPETAESDSGEIDAFVSPAGYAGQTRLDDFELPAAEAPLRDPETSHAARQAPQAAHFDVGFKPREYIPPDATPRQPARGEGHKTFPGQEKLTDPAGEQPVAAARKSPASRKETVDRLENWLKNIMKEK